ncbi:MAG: 16S rRNA (guanine(966)-N(2))-methyltransferase RsmD [Candidatus Limnocylindrales bacterium]
MSGDAGRVIAGRAAGRRLAAPGPGTRPLTDRVKQALFAILEPDLPGARFLDLCAGTGSGGLEALSRGAAQVTLVERDAGAARTIQDNLARTGLAGPAAVLVRSEAAAWLRSPAAQARGPFDIVLLDPPYDDPGLLAELLEILGQPVVPLRLAPAATVVAKHFWRAAPRAEIGLLRSVRERRFGETMLTFYRPVAEEDG